MPRRSLSLILTVLIVSLVCALRVEPNRHARNFAEIMGYIDELYVEPVDTQDLFEGAVNGMIGRLDNHSSFVSQSRAADFRSEIDQQFGGIGILVNLDPNSHTLTVARPIVGTPAHEAGLQAGDQITAIDGQSTDGFELRDAVERLRGREGTPVSIRIARPGTDKPIDVRLVRAVIDRPSVAGDVRASDGTWDYRLAEDPRIGYVRVSSFGMQTTHEIVETIERLERQGVSALMLDLRDNPGGLLEAAREVCDLFIAEGKAIVSTRGRNGKIRDSYIASGDGPFQDLKLVILVNGLSASASEIVAACLQDHGRAVIVGERTWGKGTVQNVIPVEGGRSVLRLTTATYWRPSEKNIHRHKDAGDEDEWGVRPDAGFEVAHTRQLELLRHADRMRRDSGIHGGPRHGQSVDRGGNDTAPAGDSEPGDSEAAAEAPDAESGGENSNSPDPQLRKAVEYLQEQLGTDPAEVPTSRPAA